MRHFFTDTIFGYGLFLLWVSFVIDIAKSADVGILSKIIFWAGMSVIIIIYGINLLGLDEKD